MQYSGKPQLNLLKTKKFPARKKQSVYRIVYSIQSCVRMEGEKHTNGKRGLDRAQKV